MGNDNIDFNQKFTKYIPNDISYNDLITAKDKERFKTSFESIFIRFDSKRQDGQLDFNEINDVINTFDTNKDRKISDSEIEAYCQANDIKKNVVKAFIQRIWNSFTDVNEVREGNFDWSRSRFKLTSATENNQTIYSSEIRFGSDRNSQNRMAIYDIENDTFKPCNNNQIEIVGVKAFQNATFSNGQFNTPENGSNNYPKIIITGEDGKKTEIELRITSLKLNNSDQETNYMLIMTNLTDMLANLNTTVLNDLVNNVKYIRISETDFYHSGFAHNGENYTEDYDEGITLNPRSGLNGDLTLVHEIGHTVDYNITGSITEDNKNEIEAFLNKFEYRGDIYALKNPAELYAEYYKYINSSSKNNPDESMKLFERLEKPNHPLHSDWLSVKAILENIRTESDKKNNEFNEQTLQNKNMIASFNNSANAISEAQMDIINWSNYNEFSDLRNTFENVINNYPEISQKYRLATNEEKIEIVKDLRNHPDIKPLLETLFESIERINNISFDDGLAQIERQFTSAQPQKISDKQLQNKVKGDELTNLLKSPELRDLLITVCQNNNQIPRSVCQHIENRNNPISEEILFAFKNEPSVWYYLIVEKNYFSHT